MLAVNFIQSCHNTFLSETRMSGSEVQEDLSVSLHGTEDGRHDNEFRDQTIAFRMPPSGNVYIDFTMKAFRQYICEWMGVVRDYYILHSRILDKAFKPFDLQESMNFINESNEDESITMD